MMYEEGLIDNFFKSLDDNLSLLVMGLCLASNDLIHNIDSIEDGKRGELSYHFSLSIGTVREVAKLVKDIGDSDLSRKFSKPTKAYFDALGNSLTPFDSRSLSKGTLKPIRDAAFHYDLRDHSDTEKLSDVIENLRDGSSLDIRANTNCDNPMRHRYIFADKFRSELNGKYLSEEKTKEISKVVIDLISFVDSLLYDLNTDV